MAQYEMVYTGGRVNQKQNVNRALQLKERLRMSQMAKREREHIIERDRLMDNYKLFVKQTEEIAESIEESRKIIRILRFFREIMHLSARDLEDIMEKGENKYSKSLIAAIEIGTRNPNAAFIKEYAEALQKKAKLKRSILDIAQKCIEDQELLTLMDKYEKDKGDFKTTYKIVSKINTLESMK